VEYRRLPGLPPVPPEAGATTKALWHLRDQWLPAVYAATRRELRRFRPHVVNTHEPQGLSASIFTAIRHADVPHVHTAHDFNLFCVRTTFTRNGRFCGARCTDCLPQRLIRASAARRHVSYLIAPSDYVRQQHVDRAIIHPDAALTIPNGAPPGTSRLRQVSGRPLELGYLGSLVSHKGILTLLRTLASSRVTWRLAVAGSGPLESEVRRTAAGDARIRYVGYLTDEEKDRFLDSLDVLVIPSEWEEPAPLVAVEAAVRGLPTVVSDRGGLPETPEARVFASGNPDSLMQAIDWFHGAPDRLSRASRRLLASRERFLWSSHAKLVERVLLQAAEAKTGGVPVSG
jgi:glycosyltransferase involved in cell wall biosynthesis